MRKQLLGVALGVSAVFSVAAAEPEFGGIELSMAELDAITAGGETIFLFWAAASSGTVATTVADGSAITQQFNLLGQPHQQAEVSVSQGHANAVALGEDPTVETSVLPISSVVLGPASYSHAFGLTINAGVAQMSMGWSVSSTTTANPMALTGI